MVGRESRIRAARRLTLASLAATLPRRGAACTRRGLRPEGDADSVTASEFVFLALGLGLGVAAGAALVEILRARPPARREVRVTVSPDVVPRRRSATLAEDAFVGIHAASPARGGPADRRGDGPAGAAGVMDRRTPVRSGAEISATSAVLTNQTVAALIGTEGVGEGRTELRRPLPISGGADPTLTALRASAAAGGASPARASTATALLDAPTGSADDVASSAPSAPSAQDPPATPDTRPAPTGPCAESRRLADERCELAVRARAQAAAADDAHRAAQRAYDEHEAAAETAAAAADPRAVRRAKDDAQARFRAGRAGARNREEVEAAARDWLLDINAINAESREAATTLSRERAAATAIGLTLERGAVEADAARIAAEMAEGACLAAREALAACEEAEAGGEVGHMPAMPSQAPAWESTGEDDEPLAAALGGGGNPRIFRLVRGDRAALTEIVLALAGENPEERRQWQLAFSNLVDAILADSIAAGSLAFPLEHPFWGAFTQEQDREIAAALSSLGYRFDGLGGWIDARTPSQRDLSLALGYAGLDPMRIRHWPTETEMTELFHDVQVAAAEHLSASAGALTLGELVTMLGRRADGLAEVWNHWGRIRPLLLEES
jgi:hypothetical protein